MAKEDCWTIPGSMPSSAIANIGKSIIWQNDRYVFSAKVYYGSVASSIGSWDINDDGSTIFSTTLMIGASATEGAEIVSDSLSGTDVIEVSAKSVITLNYVDGHATNPGADATVIIWSMPSGWRYRP